MENNIGPKTEPWGTPHIKGQKSDSDLPSLILCDRLLKYDENHLRAMPLTPT